MTQSNPDTDGWLDIELDELLDENLEQELFDEPHLKFLTTEPAKADALAGMPPGLPPLPQPNISDT